MDPENKSVSCLREWDASYYHQVSGKWLKGYLKLTFRALSFSTKQNESHRRMDSENILYLQFESIKSISQVMSSMVFPSILVKATNDDAHWFSSLVDRNSTFLEINHFFRGSLSQRNSNPTLISNELSSDLKHGRTKMGSTLLQSVYDSDVTLKAAAANLSQQGEQLVTMASSMQDIQEDLSVAERITSGINSWLGRWRVPEAIRRDELVVYTNHDVPDVLDVDCLYRQISSSRLGSQTVGVCRVAPSGITILSLKQKVTHHFDWPKVSRVLAVSPWEMKVTQYLIGEPDLSFAIVSVYMSRILSKIAKFAARKIEHMEPAVERGNHMKKMEDVTLPYAAIAGLSGFSSNSRGIRQDIGLPDDNQQPQCEAETQEKTISDCEAAELSHVLSSLKATALAASAEQDAQMKVIDNLTSSVARADDRIKAVNKTMNRLL